MTRVGATNLSAGEVLTAVSPSDDAGERIRPFDWRMTRRVAGRMARYSALFWSIMALAAVLAVLNGTIPLLVAQTIGGAIEQRPESWRGRLGVDPQNWLYLGVSVLVALAILWYVVMRIRQMAVAKLAERVVRDLRGEIFAHLQVLGMDFYDRTKVGRILARGTSDIDALRRALTEVAPRLTIAVVQMVYAIVVMLAYDLVLGAVVLIGAPFVYLINWRFRQLLSNSYRRVQETYSLLTANLAESIAGIRVTQAFTREERNSAMFRGICHLHRDRHLVVAKAQGLYLPLMDVTSQVFIAIALLVGGLRIAGGEMTVTDLLAFMMMTGVFFQPIIVIGDMYNVVLQAMAGAERVFHLLDTAPAQLEPPPGEALDLPRRNEGMRIEFENVTFGYQKDRPVLRDITFAAEPGQTIALVGHTGSGKTSIINLIAKFYLHDAGWIAIDGVDIRRISPRDLHSQTGIVQQENFLFTGSVLDNIRFARPEASDEQVREVCERLGCLDLIEDLPEGLHTQVGERGSSLSLGQRQLICFARAMMARPRLLILDEATSAVDTVSEHRVQQALSRLLEGRTSFVVAHRLSTIRSADRILVVDAGRIVEQGTHAQLLRDGHVYPKLHAEFVRLSEGQG